MTHVKALSLVVALALSLSPSLGLAETAAPVAAPDRPRLHHAPPSTGVAGEAIAIEATIEHAELVARAVLVVVDGAGVQELPFRRAISGPYVAIIPRDAVRAPHLSYAIELETTSGARVAVFASREAPHELQVREPVEDLRERALLARLGGLRSVVATMGELAYFGKTDANITPSGAPPGTVAQARIADQYWRAEAGYTYRMLGTVSEFGIRLGVVRGRSVVAGQPDASKYDVGLNYGAPTVRFRVQDWLHVEGELLTSVTEVGFSVGGGGAVLLGDPYGARLTLGVEGIQIFGTRGYSRMDLPISRSVTIAPTIEVTDMPHASKTGVRLFSDVRVELGGGWQAMGRVAYQARDAASGGPGFGVGAAYAFLRRGSKDHAFFLAGQSTPRMLSSGQRWRLERCLEGAKQWRRNAQRRRAARRASTK